MSADTLCARCDEERNEHNALTKACPVRSTTRPYRTAFFHETDRFAISEDAGTPPAPKIRFTCEHQSLQDAPCAHGCNDPALTEEECSRYGRPREQRALGGAETPPAGLGIKDMAKEDGYTLVPAYGIRPAAASYVTLPEYVDLLRQRLASLSSSHAETRQRLALALMELGRVPDPRTEALKAVDVRNVRGGEFRGVTRDLTADEVSAALRSSFSETTHAE
jgi:hypothetical protein